jgi:hypothetical protein
MLNARRLFDMALTDLTKTKCHFASLWSRLLILRLCFGKQQLVVCRINYAVKGGRTGLTLQIVTFKSTFIDVWSDTATKFERRVAFGARNNLRAADQRDFGRWNTGHGTPPDQQLLPHRAKLPMKLDAGICSKS